MEKIFVGFILFFFIDILHAQEGGQEKDVKEKYNLGTDLYCCPKNDYVSKSMGQCPLHGISLVKDGAYYCEIDDNIISNQAGACPKCNRSLVMMYCKGSLVPDVDTARYYK